MGYDVHRLVPDRPLILGGVKIDYELGLLGHSGMERRENHRWCAKSEL